MFLNGTTWEENDSITYVLGSGRYKGWDEGLQGMCIKEKRVLTVPPEKAFGVKGIPGKVNILFL